MKYFILLITLIFTPIMAQAENAYQRVIENNKIKCGYGIYSPWITRNIQTNEIEGIMPDIMRAVSNRLGIELIWGEETGWGNLPTSLKNGRVDVACSTLWTDPLRGKSVAFTEPAFYQPLYVYAREDDARFTGEKVQLDSENVTFSMIDGGYSASVVDRHFPNAKRNSISQINNFSEVILNVVDGKADAVISDPIFIADFNKNNKKKLKRVIEEPIVVFGNAFAVSIHEHELKEMINNTVKYMIQTGEMDQITEGFRQKYPGVMILPKKTY